MGKGRRNKAGWEGRPEDLEKQKRLFTLDQEGDKEPLKVVKQVKECSRVI